MLTKKITKLGDSHWVLIDKAIMKMLGLANKSEVTVALEKDKIVIRPVRER